MAKLAIKGHETRGTEVIALLEMLGGINVDNLYGDDTYDYYTITYDKEIAAVAFTYIDGDTYIFTLEEFEEKYPYKVGDKVLIDGDVTDIYTITSMTWGDLRVVYKIRTFDGIDNVHDWFADEMIPYKEETMKEKIQTINLECGEFADKVGVMMGNYEVEVKDGITFFIKKQPQYPKTYEECCEVLRIPKNEHYIDIDAPLVPSDYNRLVSAFTKLLICRDAYWKIVGEQMGLGKPWKPELNSKKHKFALSNVGNKISFEVYGEYNSILCFPTEEMRDAFFENFKELIEICKELL